MFFRSKKIIVTHNGSFHPDDVFGVAALYLLIGGQVKVVRTREVSIINAGHYVLDVGGEYDFPRNRFDHHQKGGAGERSNKVPYASLGLIWKHYGEKLCGDKKVSEIIDGRLVQYIDASDNGVSKLEPIIADVLPFTVGQVIMNMNPDGGSKESVFDRAFLRAVSLAKLVLADIIRTVKKEVISEIKIRKIYEDSVDKRLIVFDDFFPWQDILSKYPEPLYVVEPASTGKGYKVVCVRDNPRNFINRKNLPESWVGKRDKELAEATGVGDAVFCHNQRFVVYAASLEGALKLAKIALKDS